MKSFLMKTVPNVLLKTVSRQVLVAKKNSPHIFFGLGVIGTATSTILACRATMRLGDTLDTVRKEIEETHLLREVKSEPDTPEAQVEALHHHVDTLHVYGRAGFKIARIYAPSVIIGTASIALLAGSHAQLTRRYSTMVAAYGALEKFLADYRGRVQEEVGDERELELYHGASKELIKKGDGEVITAQVVNPTGISQYARFFDEYSPNWVKNPEYNRIFLDVQQAYANHRLNAFGHVFLNEVYDWLGVPRSKAGAVVGWVKNGDGDDYISFGVFDAWNSRFVNGSEPSILLDFNVDGVIYDKI